LWNELNLLGEKCLSYRIRVVGATTVTKNVADIVDGILEAVVEASLLGPIEEE